MAPLALIAVRAAGRPLPRSRRPWWARRPASGGTLAAGAATTARPILTLLADRLVHPFGLDRADGRDCIVPQGLDLVPGELPPLAGEEVAQRELADANPFELVDLVAEPRQHPANLAILALVEDHFQDGTQLVLRADVHPLGVHFSLGQRDAPANLVEQLLGRHACHLHEIFLFHAVAGMGEKVGQCPVVGDEDQPLAHAVEPADGKQPLLARHEVDHTGPAVGIEVGGHHAHRLIEHVDDPLRVGQFLTVHPHLGLERIDPRAE